MSFQVSILSGSFGTNIGSSLMTTVLFVMLLGRSLSIGFIFTGPTLTWTSRAALHDDQLMDFIAALYTWLCHTEQTLWCRAKTGKKEGEQQLMGLRVCDSLCHYTTSSAAMGPNVSIKME